MARSPSPIEIGIHTPARIWNVSSRTCATFIVLMEKWLNILFGLLIGAMWMGEVLLGNLGGTSVFGYLRDVHPRVFALAPAFALAAVGVTLFGVMLAAYQHNRIPADLRVGSGAELLRGGIVLLTLLAITLFHSAMMGDPAHIHEFGRSAHQLPTHAELSSFLHTDALGGGLNHLWIVPLLGVTVEAVGAIFGKRQRQSEASASAR